jgi:hypothetical protein
MAIKEIAQNKIPIMEETKSGIVENATIPSIEYARSFQKLHFVSPWARSIFSYSSHFVRKPTQPNIPFEKRLYSPTSRIAFTILRFISR